MSGYCFYQTSPLGSSGMALTMTIKALSWLQVEHHGREIDADFARLGEHIKAKMAVMEIVADGLGINTRGAQGDVESIDPELDLRQLCDLPLVRTTDFVHLFFAFSPTLS